MPRVPKILLLQARHAHDPMRGHEVECFCEQTGLPEEAFRIVSLAFDAFGGDLLDGVDAVMVGGSGDFSVVEGGFDWHDKMLELLRTIIARRVPTFASCFGFQALVQCLGGELERDPERGEVGTFDINLTDDGHNDPLFDGFPTRFKAQLGHLDRATRLPDELVHLAHSERCDYQAIRLRGAPVFATQFHPELSCQANLERYIYYIEHYKAPGMTKEEAIEEAMALYAESPESSSLLRRFLELELGYKDG